MTSVVRRVTRWLVVLSVVAAPFTPPPSNASQSGETPVAGLYPEVRLRKLHLVRPDLIPYPISYEVCC
jgi:hypothetical protein